MSNEPKGPRIFYGWLVVAACFAATFTLGEALFTFGVFFKPLKNEFGWSRALVSSGYTAFLIGYCISVMTGGRLADRYSPRPILFVSGLLAGFGISLCSQIQNVNQLRIFLFIGGLGAGATWSVPTSTVQRWFYRRRRAGVALGIVVAGFGVGCLVFAPLINYLVLTYGWRGAYLFAGVLFFIILAISSLIIKQAPANTGTVSQGERSMPNHQTIHSWGTGKAVTTSSFAGITFIHCVAVLAFQILAVHFVPHATDADISPTASAAALGLLGGLSVPGRIVSGFISDKVAWQKTLVLSCFGMSLSLPLLLFLKEYWMLYCFVFFYGLCHGSRVSAHIGILGEFYGLRSLGELIGISTAIAVFIGAFAPYVAGFIFDTTGSYSVVFTIVMLLFLISGIIAHTMKRPELMISS